MTWALIIGSWLAVALVLGLVIGAMIRRAEAKEHSQDARPLAIVEDGSGRPTAPEPRAPHRPRPRRYHSIE
jgi:hypothetical protein